MVNESSPRILVLSSLFPSSARPQAGLFIRERMFRVAESLPLKVVSPQPWFPLQGLIRLWRSHFRPLPPRHEIQQGIEVFYPRFFSVPGFFKGWDGFFMALACYPALKKLHRNFPFDVIDAHFAYPDGYAAGVLGRWLQVPVTITLRGTEVPLTQDPSRRRCILKALDRATKVFAVSQSLKRHLAALGADADKITVVGNGVDTGKFCPIDQAEARHKIGIPADSKVLITVGALVPRKGQLRIIDLLPELIQTYPNLIYLIVGGGSPEGDVGDRLKRRVSELGIDHHVRFLGAVSPDDLKIPLSASDVFVLATSNEGWANVLLEAMACGLPVVTTDVGGNREVVSGPELGTIVPLGDREALLTALEHALEKRWERERILTYARENNWDSRVQTLLSCFRNITREMK